MNPLYIIMLAVMLISVVVILKRYSWQMTRDCRIFLLVLKDDPEKRKAKITKRNEIFVESLKKVDEKYKSELQKSPTNELLNEARKNLEYSFELRAQENQSILSITAVLLGMFSAFFYLSKKIVYIEIDYINLLYMILLIFCLITLIIASVFLLESFKPTYLIPNSTDDKIKNALENECIRSDCNANEVKYALISENAIRSKINEHSNILKSKCWDVARRYMMYAGFFLLMMMITWGLYKIYTNFMICCCS